MQKNIWEGILMATKLTMEDFTLIMQKTCSSTREYCDGKTIAAFFEDLYWFSLEVVEEVFSDIKRNIGKLPTGSEIVKMCERVEKKDLPQKNNDDKNFYENFKLNSAYNSLCRHCTNLVLAGKLNLDDAKFLNQKIYDYKLNHGLKGFQDCIEFLKKELKQRGIKDVNI